MVTFTFTINIPQMLAYIPYMDPMSNYSWEMAESALRWLNLDMSIPMGTFFRCGPGHGKTSLADCHRLPTCGKHTRHTYIWGWFYTSLLSWFWAWFLIWFTTFIVSPSIYSIPPMRGTSIVRNRIQDVQPNEFRWSVEFLLIFSSDSVAVTSSCKSSKTWAF